MIKDGQPVPDGTVSVNFNNNWGYEGVVGSGQYDYESVMMHELMGLDPILWTRDLWLGGFGQRSERRLVL